MKRFALRNYFLSNCVIKSATAIILAIAIGTSAVSAYAQEVLRVSAIPDEAPTELQRKFKPLGEYLEKKIGMKVEFTPVLIMPQPWKR